MHLQVWLQRECKFDFFLAKKNKEKKIQDIVENRNGRVKFLVNKQRERVKIMFTLMR